MAALLTWNIVILKCCSKAHSPLVQYPLMIHRTTADSKTTKIVRIGTGNKCDAKCLVLVALSTAYGATWTRDIRAPDSVTGPYI
ncbi:hypothetical protein L208DRAFT_1409063 [Tricholoma matsutake]|nr:hypothetical protein L208DRAFT_1409063 [Tricholoma matsutake 945]